MIAAGEYARCRQLVFMPRIKFPFFFFSTVTGSIISRARGHFRAITSEAAVFSRFFDCFPISFSLSFSLSLSLHRWAAFSRPFSLFFNRFSTSNNPFFQCSTFHTFGSVISTPPRFRGSCRTWSTLSSRRRTTREPQEGGAIVQRRWQGGAKNCAEDESLTHR